MGAPEIWHIRGEGGSVDRYQLPLPEGLEGRLVSGACVRVNPDGTRWTPPAPEVAADVAPAVLLPDAPGGAPVAPIPAASSTDSPPVPVWPGRGAKKAQLVAYAVGTGTITHEAADDLTAAELLARFAPKADD